MTTPALQQTAHTPDDGVDLHEFHWFSSLVAGVVCALSAGLLVVAAQLSPVPGGVGTHTQLGMAPCGFLDNTGMPCATCGMTTSFALAADGRLIDAFINQPAGAMLALMVAVVAILSGYATFKGLSILPMFQALWRPATIIITGIVVLGSWGYKILIMQGT